MNMALVIMPELFEGIYAMANKVRDPAARLPLQVFEKNFTEFVCIDLDEIFTEEFYEWMNQFVRSISESTWYFLVDEPDPRDFFSMFGKYPAFEVAVNDPYREYWFNVSEEPSQDTNHAIFYAGTSRIILFSKSFGWCLFLDRDFELGIAGFSRPDIALEFSKAFGTENVFTIDEAIDTFLFPSFRMKSIRESLLKNYSS